MSFKINITETASLDLDCIYEYIAVNLQSPQNAKLQLRRLIESINKLDEMPERFHLYESEKSSLRNMRMMPVDNYSIYYIPDLENETVAIIRVISQRQDRSRQF